MEFGRLDSHANASEAERRHRDGIRSAHPAIFRAHRRAWRRTGLAAVALVVPLVIWIVVTSNPGSVPEARPLERVVVDDAALELHWAGADCEQVDAARSQITEAPDEVLVVLWVEATSDDCTDGEVDRVHPVALEDALGGRDIIDGACLKPENREHSQCADGAAGDGSRAPCRFCVHPEPAHSEPPRVRPK